MPTVDPSDRSTDARIPEVPTLEDVLACACDVRPIALETYRELREAPASTVAELATALDRDRSNVTRSLDALREIGLASRRRHLLDGGGHVYRYEPTPLPEARERLHDRLDAWASHGHDRIDEFGP